MSSSHRYLRLPVFLCLASILPATVGAQPPVFVSAWGFPGSGNGEFNEPQKVAVGASGNVFVVDWQRESIGGNCRIQKFTADGIYLAQWGSSGIGNDQFASPSGVGTDAMGNVYVTDQGNHRVQKFDETGAYITQWGTFGSGPGEMNNPTSVTTDAVRLLLCQVAKQSGRRVTWPATQVRLVRMLCRRCS